MTITETIKLFRRMSVTSTILYKPNQKTLSQIATWLEELKELKKMCDDCPIHKQYKDEVAQHNEELERVYNLALADLIKKLEEIDPCEFASYTLCLVKEKADELKVGGKNDT